MYKTNAKLNKDLKVVSETNGFEYIMDYSINDKNLSGTSPVGLLSSALSGCILMVIKSYYLRKKINDISLNYVSTLKDKTFDIVIEINKKISVEEELDLRKALKERCNVSNMLDKSVILNILIKGH